MMGSGGDDDEENMIYICGVSQNVKNNKNDERMSMHCYYVHCI